MNIEISKFGDILVSRPAGKEAFLMAKAYIFNSLKKDEELSLDFANVKVLTPSWADEFITGIKSNYNAKINYINTQNESVWLSSTKRLKMASLTASGRSGAAPFSLSSQ